MTELIVEKPSPSILSQAAGIFAQPTTGLLIVTDADRADFLHRMTTNEINHLPPGHATVTVLTSPTARITQVFTVLCKDDALWLLPAPGEAAALARHLQGQIFFMDKVKVQDASGAYQRLRLIGAAASAVLADIGLNTTDLAAESWREESFNGEPMLILNQQAYGVPGFELVLPHPVAPALLAALQSAGAAIIDADAYHGARIELGRPAPGHELTADYNPLEAGLGWSCADNKGCYTGQEIIARQVTYDKITKTLVGLRSEAPLAVGEELSAAGRVVGTVTSSVATTRQGPLALAIVKRPHNEIGTTLQATDVPVQIVALPFS